MVNPALVISIKTVIYNQLSAQYVTIMLRCMSEQSDFHMTVINCSNSCTAPFFQFLPAKFMSTVGLLIFKCNWSCQWKEQDKHLFTYTHKYNRPTCIDTTPAGDGVQRYVLCLVTGGFRFEFISNHCIATLDKLLTHNCAETRWPIGQRDRPVTRCRVRGSTLVRDSYCDVGTLIKFLTHNCSPVLMQSAP